MRLATKNKKQQAYKRGLYAEILACVVLCFKGYRIKERRFKRYGGEIDIIAQRRNMIVFVEVKARKTMAAACEAIQPKSQQRIVKAAQSYIHENPATINMAMRFDVFAVVGAFSWRHLDNAWQTTA